MIHTMNYLWTDLWSRFGTVTRLRTNIRPVKEMFDTEKAKNCQERGKIGLSFKAL